MKKPIKTEEEKSCYLCGKTGHGPSSCGFRGSQVFLIVANWGMLRASVGARKSYQEARTTRAHHVGLRNGWTPILLHRR